MRKAGKATAVPNAPLKSTAPPFLLLKATAAQIPLRTGSVDLVIATPPYVGERRTRRGQYCTSDEKEFERFVAQWLAEATRIIKPGGHVLLHTRRPRRRIPERKKPIAFTVFRKRGHEVKEVGRETFTARYTWVGQLPWAALPVWLYREIVRRHSRPGDIVVHLFSGSGNGGLAALELLRRPLLIDLHYHRAVRRRLKKSLRRFRRAQLSSKPYFA
jgi:hypothetical protein